MDDSVAQNTFTLTMNEYEFLSFLVLVLFECMAENVELVFKNIPTGHSLKSTRYPSAPATP